MWVDVINTHILVLMDVQIGTYYDGYITFFFKPIDVDVNVHVIVATAYCIYKLKYMIHLIGSKIVLDSISTG